MVTNSDHKLLLVIHKSLSLSFRPTFETPVLAAILINLNPDKPDTFNRRWSGSISNAPVTLRPVNEDPVRLKRNTLKQSQQISKIQ